MTIFRKCNNKSLIRNNFVINLITDVRYSVTIPDERNKRTYSAILTCDFREHLKKGKDFLKAENNRLASDLP